MGIPEMNAHDMEIFVLFFEYQMLINELINTCSNVKIDTFSKYKIAETMVELDIN